MVRAERHTEGVEETAGGGSSAFSRRELLRGAGAVLGAAIVGAGVASCSSNSGSSASSKWQGLASQLTGTLLHPGDPGYARMAPPYNRRYVDVEPQAIAVCKSATDVQRCVSWARQHGVPFAVRSGGHSYAGYSATGGLLISVASLRSLTMDPATKRITLGAGVQNRDLFASLPRLDVGVPNGRCPTVGMGGFVLGGGFGFNSRKFGLASDNLVQTRVVTSDGQLLVCDADQHSDLFWACRGGGGGNFGINVDYVLQSQPVGELSLYKLRWKWSDAPAVMAAAQVLQASAPDALSARVGLDVASTTPPAKDPSGLSVSALGQFFGPVDQLETLLAPLLAAAPTTEKVIRSMDYTEALAFFAQNVPVGRFTEKSVYIGPDGFDTSFVETGMTWIEKWPGSANVTAVGLTLFAWGGAMGRPAPGATAFVHRDASWLSVVGTSWGPDDSQELIEENLAWVGQFFDALDPFVTDQSYQNFADPALADWQTAYYGTNLPRLVDVKQAYDPENVFAFPQGIPTGT